MLFAASSIASRSTFTFTMRFRPLRIDYDADAAMILQEAERRERQDQQDGGDDDGQNSRSNKRRCVIWLSTKTPTTTATTTWEDESHDGGNGHGGDGSDRSSDDVGTKECYHGQEALVEAPKIPAGGARSIYSSSSNDNDYRNEEDECAASASAILWRAIPPSTAMGEEIPEKIIDIIGGTTSGTETMGRRNESMEEHPYMSPRQQHYHDRNNTQCDETMAFSTHGTKRGLGLDDEDENSSFVAVFRPPKAYIDWMKEDAAVRPYLAISVRQTFKVAATTYSTHFPSPHCSTPFSEDR